jgi:hypothetical protein
MLFRTVNTRHLLLKITNLIHINVDFDNILNHRHHHEM